MRPVAATSADCSPATGDRLIRIAKPGLIGGLIGAGLGAAGGAIADGGKAAGKGALIGGIAGTALGGAYGTYKTKQECGTVFGGGTGSAFSGETAPAVRDAVITPTQSAYRPSTTDGITVYNAGKPGQGF